MIINYGNGGPRNILVCFTKQVYCTVHIRYFQSCILIGVSVCVQYVLNAVVWRYSLQSKNAELHDY